MAVKAALIRIEPKNEIRFIGPFNTTVSTQLKLTNMTENQVFFKIKTTSPRSYCVRPNDGLIGPMEVGIVQIILQPFDYNPNDKQLSKHKFMVQSRYAPENATTADSDNAFKVVTEEMEIHDARLRSVFELPAQSEEDNPFSTIEPLQHFFEKKVNRNPVETTAQEDPSLHLEIDTIRKRNAALIMENIELKKNSSRPTPVTYPSLRLEIDTIRKRNAALIMENIELKKNSSRPTLVTYHTQEDPSLRLEIDTIRKRNAALIMEKIELKKNSSRPTPVTYHTQEDPSLRLEIDTIRKRNAALIMENIELKKNSSRPTPVTYHTQEDPSLRLEIDTIRKRNAALIMENIELTTLLNILTEEMEMHDARLKCGFELPAQSEDNPFSTIEQLQHSFEKKVNLDPAETTAQEDPSLRLEIDTIRKRNAALILENIELKKISRPSPVTSHSPGQALKKTSALLNILTEEMEMLDSCLKCGLELPAQSEDNPFSTIEQLQHSFEKKVNLDPADDHTRRPHKKTLPSI